MSSSNHLKLSVPITFHAKKGDVLLTSPSPYVHYPKMQKPSSSSCSRCVTSGKLSESYCGPGASQKTCPTEADSSYVPQLTQMQTGCTNCSSIYEANQGRTSLDLIQNKFYTDVVAPSTDYNLTSLVFPY